MWLWVSLGKKFSQLDFFYVSKIRRECIKGKFQLYNFIRDMAYPVSSWMYCLFRNEKIALSRKEENLELYSSFNQYVCKTE